MNCIFPILKVSGVSMCFAPIILLKILSVEQDWGSTIVALILFCRTKIMQNIGIVFVKMGQYNDAITSFEHIMSESPSFKTGFNLILCYFSLGDRNKMRTAFQKLLMVDLKADDEDKYLAHGVSCSVCMCLCVCV